jgi:hypothetical protein
MSSLYFELKDDAESMASVVEKMPNRWERFGGELRATLGGGFTEEQVAKQTGFYFGNFHGAQIGGWGKHKPDLIGLLAGGKHPHFLYFEREFNMHPDHLVLVGALVRKGYRGNINFESTFYQSDRTHWTDGCHIYFGTWEVKKGIFCRFEDEGLGVHSPRLKLWYSDRDGRYDSIKPAVEFCRSLGLREYQAPAVKAA